MIRGFLRKKERPVDNSLLFGQNSAIVGQAVCRFAVRFVFSRVIVVENLFPCPVGDLQNVEPTLTKRVSPLFSKGRLLVNIPDGTMSYAHLFHRFKYSADTAGWGFFYYQNNSFYSVFISRAPWKEVCVSR